MLSIGVPIVLLIIMVGALFGSAGQLSEVRKKLRLLALGCALGAVITFVLACVVTITPGHTGVAVFFGRVIEAPRPAGLHFANPLYNWVYYDCRQKTHMEEVQVPARDQLMTKMDISVQFKMIPSMTPTVLSETGTLQDVITIHLQPKVRSVLREAGKAVEKAEDFFTEETQTRIQAELYTVLEHDLKDKGLDIQEVLLRDLQLPETIRVGVESKKKREQEAERETAELRRFETEQEKIVKTAQAERQAAEEEAAMRMVLADAKAYEIEKINTAIASNPAYIQLGALKALQSISKDPSAKIYFINGDSPSPLPLMHMGLEKQQ